MTPASAIIRAAMGNRSASASEIVQASRAGRNAELCREGADRCQRRAISRVQSPGQAATGQTLLPPRTWLSTSVRPLLLLTASHAQTVGVARPIHLTGDAASRSQIRRCERYASGFL